MADIKLPHPKWGTFKEDFIEFRISQGQLRARDLEVAKLVLEAAAVVAEKYFHTTTAKVIRALEIDHD
jgi:hypothetical protein